MEKFFQIWLTVAGYEEFFYVCDFSRSEAEIYFEWIKKFHYYNISLVPSIYTSWSFLSIYPIPQGG